MQQTKSNDQRGPTLCKDTRNDNEKSNAPSGTTEQAVACTARSLFCRRRGRLVLVVVAVILCVIVEVRHVIRVATTEVELILALCPKLSIVVR